LIEHKILIIIVFAVTTAFYILLYKKLTSQTMTPHNLENAEVNEEKFTKIRETLSNKHLDVEKLLADLREMRKIAESLLDEENRAEEISE